MKNKIFFYFSYVYTSITFHQFAISFLDNQNRLTCEFFLHFPRSLNRKYQGNQHWISSLMINMNEWNDMEERKSFWVCPMVFSTLALQCAHYCACWHDHKCWCANTQISCHLSTGVQKLEKGNFFNPKAVIFPIAHKINDVSKSFSYEEVSKKYVNDFVF